LVPLEYVSGGNLYEHVLEFGALGEPRSRLYAAELGCTLDYLHAHRIIFRDLKTENILLGADGHLKLTDFGLSTIPTRGRATTICGTPHTIAPEIVRREEYDHRVDWYSLGACLFECLTGHAPFASLSTDLSALLHSVIHREPRLPKQLSSTCRALLGDLLAKDPNRRISSIDQLLNHPWFTHLSTPFTKEHILKKSFQPDFLPLPSPHRLSKSSFPTATSSSSTTTSSSSSSSSSSHSFSVSAHSFSDSASSSDDDHNHPSDSSALINHHLFLPPHSPSSSLTFLHP
jgi:serine/threonine protein kinase